MKIVFTVFGEPKTAGSKRGFLNKKSGRVMMVDANPESRYWKETVSSAGRQAYTGDLLRGELEMTLTFYRPRPQGHYRSGGGFSKSGRESLAPTTRPDLLKLARAVEDALTRVIYLDDSQIVIEHLFKQYGEPARCEVMIETRGLL